MWNEDAVDRVRARAYWRRAHAHLPLTDEVIQHLSSNEPPEPTRPINSHFALHSLADASGWLRLHERFSYLGLGNYAPWNRCLSVLYGHGAKTCLMESHYVCLDYKSEVLAFYSQLDAPRMLATTRLHFFQAELTEASLQDLEHYQTMYLGYIVCRPGGLPLVGRTIIKPPDYIDDCASIQERVNLLGQTLIVEGVPFMQQDSKLAVCSQVAVWAAQYTNFRRGLLQRNLIAEVVAQSGVIEPLKPRISDGMDLSEAAELLRKAGLGTYIYRLAEDLDVPVLPPEIVPGAPTVVGNIKNDLGTAVLEKIRDEDHLGEFITDVNDHISRQGLEPDSDLAKLNSQLYDLVLATVFKPYIRSRFPLYLSTRDHALVLCGLTQRVGDPALAPPIFFVHDDQFGPYLATPSLASGSRDALRQQAFFGQPAPSIMSNEHVGEGAAFPSDRTAEIIEGASAFVTGDVERSVQGVVVPTPRRVTMTPADAEADAYNTFGSILYDARWSVRSVLMMGIDYKRSRRLVLRAENDGAGAAAFGNVHLAEWVIVVADECDDRECSWEIVYDASSDAHSPRIQMARFGDRVLVESIGNESPVEEGRITLARLPNIEVEPKIGKTN